MRRLLTASIFGTILGIVGAYSTANASIVSSGFLDEKLTEYALSTSLDLKANQSDLTALSNKIGNDWPFFISEMLPGLYDFVSEFYPHQISLKNTSDFAHFLFGGALESGLYANAPGVLNLLGEQIIYFGDHEFRSEKMLDGFRSLIQLTHGWTDSNDGTTYLGIKNLNTKIGPLPAEIVIGNSNGAMEMFNITKMQRVSLPKDYTLSDFIQDMYYGSFGSNVGLGESPFYGLSDVIDHVMYGGVISEASPVLTGERYKGLIDLTLEIGTLPTGDVLNSPLADNLNHFVQGTDDPVYPDSLAKLIEQIYGTPEHPGILTSILYGYPHNGVVSVISPLLGIVPAMQIAESADSLAKSNARKIGTVPDGQTVAGMATTANTNANTAIAKIGTLPAGYDSVGAALTAIKGIAEDAKAAALAAIPDPKQEGSSGKYVLTVDIVGDNATYHWEKIDREGEATTTSE